MNDLQPRINGLGYFVPPNLRTNDDPIFDWLKKNPPPGHDLFAGYKTRVVLGPGEDLMTMMVPAALNAMEAAQVEPSDIDMLLGYASVSPYATPNELSRLHQMLHLSPNAYVVPLNNEFSNFNAGLLFADALIRAGRARKILIVVGANWTQHVDYRTAQSVSAADGAGAAVVGLSSSGRQWRVVDHETLMDTSLYGAMFMQGRKYPQPAQTDGRQWLWSDPFFQITPEGITDFGTFGGHTAPRAVDALLRRNRIQDSNWTLIAHQASTTLFEMWKETLRPAQTIQTIEDFANMTVANIAVNFAWSEKNDPVSQNTLVLFALAPDMHCNALLLQRDPS